MLNNSLCIKLFDRKFVANTLRNHRRCPNCRSEYSYTYDVVDKYARDAHHIRSNRPILLPCNHNMCENCVYQHRHNLNCHVCLKPVNISADLLRHVSHFPMRDHFDMNFFLLGEQNHLRFYRKDGSANSSLLIADQVHSAMDISSAIGESKAAASSTIQCVECELVPAMGKCRQCKIYLCKHCFDSIHVNSKIMKTHHFLSIRSHTANKATAIELSLKPRFCKRHHRRIGDRFCQKCKSVCCLECARNIHQHHSYTTLLDWNNSHVDEVGVTLENVNTSRDILKKALKVSLNTVIMDIYK